MTLVWDGDRVAVDRIRMALGDQVRVVETASAAARELAADRRETEVVVGPGVDAAAAARLAERLRVERPEVGVLLVRHRLDVGVLSQALRSGVREVVATDDLTGLAEAVARSREVTVAMGGTLTGPGAEGDVVTVFSAKGGVGKTTLSVNLGAQLAASGAQVLLVDLDLAFGDVAISLQQLPERTISDLVAMGGHLDEPGLRSVLTPHGCGLDVLAAPPGPSEAEGVPAATVAEVLRVARHRYDHVIVDCPPAFTEHVLTAVDTSDLIVLIATLDIPAVKNLRLTLETLDLLGTPRENRLLVLNRSDAKVGLRASDVVTAVGQDISVTVPSSLDVPASVNRGVPLVLDSPRHPVSAAVRDLADRVARGTGGRQAGSTDTAGDPVADGSPSSPRRRIWSRR